MILKYPIRGQFSPPWFGIFSAWGFEGLSSAHMVWGGYEYICRVTICSSMLCFQIFWKILKIITMVVIEYRGGGHTRSNQSWRTYLVVSYHVNRYSPSNRFLLLCYFKSEPIAHLIFYSLTRVVPCKLRTYTLHRTSIILRTALARARAHLYQLGHLKYLILLRITEYAIRLSQ